jgi:hypothetical protein
MARRKEKIITKKVIMVKAMTIMRAIIGKKASSGSYLINCRLNPHFHDKTETESRHQMMGIS